MSNKDIIQCILMLLMVVSGTAIECAQQLKKILNCFYSLVSKNTLGVLNKRYTVYSEPLDEKENDDENIYDRT